MQIHSSSRIAIRGKNIIFGPDTSALVFATHPSAYEEAGIATLNPAEQVVIGLTPDPNTWLDPTARGQAKAILEYIAEKEYGPALEDPQTYFRFTNNYLSAGMGSAVMSEVFQ